MVGLDAAAARMRHTRRRRHTIHGPKPCLWCLGEISCAALAVDDDPTVCVCVLAICAGAWRICCSPHRAAAGY